MGAPLRRLDTDNQFSQAIFNELADAIESHIAYILGRGVISGLELSIISGFTLGISAGRASNGLRLVEIVDDFTQTANPSVTEFVWLTPETGAIVLTSTSADPGGTSVPLGTVTSDGSGITSVSMLPASGRAELGRFVNLRTFKLGGVLELDLLTGRAGIGKVPTVELDVSGTIAADEVVTPLGLVSVLSLPQVGSSPGAPTDAVYFYSKNVSGTAEAFMKSEGGVETQLTRAGRPKGIAIGYRQTAIQANDTRSTSTAENAFASAYTIDANTLHAEQTLRLVASGVYGSKAIAPGNLTLRLKFGATVLAAATIALVTSLTNRAFSISADLIVRTIGATGTIEVQGIVTVFTAAGVAVLYELVNTGTITIDTTAGADLGISAQFDTSDAANTITQRVLIVETSLD